MGSWDVFLASVRAFDAKKADRIAALSEDERLGEVLGFITEIRSLAESQAATIKELTPKAAQGDKWLDSLADEAKANRVRAEGKDFDGDKYRAAIRATNDPDYMKGESVSWARAAETALGGGRPTTSAKEKIDAETASPFFRKNDVYLG